MEAHNLGATERAMAAALKLVSDVFAAHDLGPKAISINVVFETRDVEWAAGSAVPDAQPNTLRLLAGSLHTSGDEVRERVEETGEPT